MPMQEQENGQLKRILAKANIFLTQALLPVFQGIVYMASEIAGLATGVMESSTFDFVLEIDVNFF